MQKGRQKTRVLQDEHPFTQLVFLFTFNERAWQGFLEDVKFSKRNYTKRGTWPKLSPHFRASIRKLSEAQWEALVSRDPDNMNIQIGAEFTIAARAKRKTGKGPDLVGGMPVIVEDWPALKNYP